MKAEYYDKNGKEYKVITAEKIENIQGIPTITEMKVEDLTSGGFTVINYEEVEYNLNIDDRVFSERYLRRPPLKWIKR